MEKIDFVLPWVDSSDKNWQELRKKYNDKIDDDSNSNARFRDMDTLKYVLRSIERNCPWYNKIFLITQGHYPKWLNINHKKIVLITHNELYFNKSDLPIFSSPSIEMNLANLKGVSQKFIYLNDDMIIFRKVSPERFFKKNLPVDFLIHGWIKRGKIFDKLGGIDSWISSINNNLNLINTKFKVKDIKNYYLYQKSYTIKGIFSNFLMKNIYKKAFWIEHWHHPQPYLKSIVDKTFEDFQQEMLKVSKNRFRDYSDLNQYIYRYYQLFSMNFYPFKHNDGYVKNIDSLEKLEDMIKYIKSNKNINFVCFNDSVNLSDNEFEKVKKNLSLFLKNTFDKKASFEI